MQHFFQLSTYFIVGILETILQVIILRYVTKEKATHASIVAFLNSLIYFGVVVSIIANFQSNLQSGWENILVFSIGIAVGTYIGIKFKLEKTIVGK